MLFLGRNGRYAVQAAALERLLELVERVSDEGQAAGRFQLVEEKSLVVAQLVAAGFDFHADEHGVGLAETDDVGYAAAGLRINLVAAEGLVVDAGGILALDGEAMVGEVGQDGAGNFAATELAVVERQLVVLLG